MEKLKEQDKELKKRIEKSKKDKLKALKEKKVILK
jgi:hypothetical protein